MIAKSLEWISALLLRLCFIYMEIIFEMFRFSYPERQYSIYVIGSRFRETVRDGLKSVELGIDDLSDEHVYAISNNVVAYYYKKYDLYDFGIYN